MKSNVQAEKHKIHVGQSIRNARVYTELKQEALASSLPLKQQDISKIEQQEEVEDVILQKIAFFLNFRSEVIKSCDSTQMLQFTDTHSSERFNRSYREGALDAFILTSIHEAREETLIWMEDYNNNHPHESLGDKTPAECA